MSEPWDAEGGALTYDRNGNAAAVGPTGLTAATYDWRNLPVSMARGGVTTRYRYAASGDRYWRRVGSATAEYLALDGAVTVGAFSASGALKEWNVLAGGVVVGRVAASGARAYYHADALGSVRAVTDAAGAVVEGRDFDPWGLALSGRQTGGPTREGFTGHEYDGDTGLNYAGARYYVPALGRWTSVDPLAGEFPGLSPYNYALNNPFSLVDPDGMAPEDCCRRVFRGIGRALRSEVSATSQTVRHPIRTARAAYDGVRAAARDPRGTARAVRDGAVSTARELRTASGERRAEIVTGAVLAVIPSPTKVGRAARAAGVLGDAAGDARRLIPERAGPVGHISPGEVMNRTPSEIDANARRIGLNPQGPDPAHGRGSYTDPVTGEQRILSQPNDRHGPHGHVNGPDGRRVGPSGTPVGKRTDDAHLPIRRD